MKRLPIRSELTRLAGYSFKPRPGLVKLDQNESPYDIPEGIKRKILGRLGRLEWNRYPTPFADRVAAAIGRRNRWPAEGVVVATGSNVLIQALVMATSLRGTTLHLNPGFYLYEIESGLLGNRRIAVPLGPEWAFPRVRILSALKKERPDLVMIANPHAPTGSLFPVRDILEVVRQARSLVVVDEAYFEFSGVTVAPALRRYPNLVVVRTLSKAFGAAGVRLGYLLASPRVAREIKKVILPFSVSAIQIEIALALLQNPYWVRANVRAVLGERRRLEREMRRIPGVEVVPTEANFIAFRVGRQKAAFNRFLAGGVVVRDISRPGPLDGMLRVTVGTPQENNRFLRVLRGIALR